jgi:hypothetical protein
MSNGNSSIAGSHFEMGVKLRSSGRRMVSTIECCERSPELDNLIGRPRRSAFFLLANFTDNRSSGNSGRDVCPRTCSAFEIALSQQLLVRIDDGQPRYA